MQSNNFDFGRFFHGNDEQHDTDSDVGAQEVMSVRAVLGFKFGERRGSMIYRLLERLAKRAAKSNGGDPGLLFTDEGGEFVSFHNNSEQD